jgi:hypothetical protein
MPTDTNKILKVKEDPDLNGFAESAHALCILAQEAEERKILEQLFSLVSLKK